MYSSDEKQRLALSDKTLANWVFRAGHVQLAWEGEARCPVTDLEAEVSRLKREPAEARMERDIGERAAASGHPGRACSHPADVRTRATPSGIAG